MDGISILGNSILGNSGTINKVGEVFASTLGAVGNGGGSLGGCGSVVLVVPLLIVVSTDATILDGMAEISSIVSSMNAVACF